MKKLPNLSNRSAFIHTLIQLFGLLVALIMTAAPANAQTPAPPTELPTPTPTATATPILTPTATLVPLTGDSDSGVFGPQLGIDYGLQVSGFITNDEPRAVYAFDGLRGEVLNLTLTTTSGTLDPVLTVLDSSGAILASRDDSDGGRDVILEAVRVPSTAPYYIVVGRFGYGVGTTTGGYDLTIERVGVSSASGSALRYGDTVINNITDMHPQLYYSFRAAQGDVVNVRMNRISGDLDTYLQVVSRDALVLADNDEVPGSGSLDAAINGFVVEEEGTYVIIASRFGQAAGTSTGSFFLTLEEADNSGLGNSPEAAQAITSGVTVEGEITNAGFVQYYRFEARVNDIVSVRMERIDGALDAFLALADSTLLELTTDDDGGGGQNAQIVQYRIPADGTYYLLATRFQREGGTTQGRYQLLFENQGSAFAGVPDDVQRIGYGTTITGSITADTPQVLYAFWGVAGDAVTVSLNRGDGDLDPVVAILDAEGSTVASNDDAVGQNARIERYELPETGVYYVRATRFSGEDGRSDTSGSYILVLAQRFD